MVFNRWRMLIIRSQTASNEKKSSQRAEKKLSLIHFISQRIKKKRACSNSLPGTENATNGGGGNDDDRDDQINPQTKLKDVYIKIYLANDTVHFDQTGCFPATSSRGNKYIMVLDTISAVKSRRLLKVLLDQDQP